METIQEFKDITTITDCFEDKILLANNSKNEKVCCDLFSGIVTQLPYLNGAIKFNSKNTIVCNYLANQQAAPQKNLGIFYQLINQNLILLVKWTIDAINIYFDITLNKVKDGTLVATTNKLKINLIRTDNTTVVNVEIHKLTIQNSYLITISSYITMKENSCYIFTIEEQKIIVDSFPNCQCILSEFSSDNLLFYNSNDKIIKFYNPVTKKDKTIQREFSRLSTFNDSIMQIDAKNGNEPVTIIITNYKTMKLDTKLKFNVSINKDVITLSAADFFHDYECVISNILDPKCIKSMTQLYEIINDAITINDEYIEFKYEKINNTIKVNINLLYKYMKTSLTYTLIQKSTDPLLILEKKVDYLCAKIN